MHTLELLQFIHSSCTRSYYCPPRIVPAPVGSRDTFYFGKCSSCLLGSHVPTGLPFPDCLFTSLVSQSSEAVPALHPLLGEAGTCDFPPAPFIHSHLSTAVDSWLPVWRRGGLAAGPRGELRPAGVGNFICASHPAGSQTPLKRCL